MQADNASSERRLSAAALADEGETLAGADRERDVVKDFLLVRASTVRGDKVLDGEQLTTRRGRIAVGPQSQVCPELRRLLGIETANEPSGPALVGAGNSVRHTSVASGQRGSNEQPAGRPPGGGAVPAIPISSWRNESRGTELSSSAVYGCVGSRNT